MARTNDVSHPIYAQCLAAQCGELTWTTSLATPHTTAALRDSTYIVNKSDLAMTERKVKSLRFNSSPVWERLSIWSYREARGIAHDTNKHFPLAVLSRQLPLDELLNLKRALRAAFLTIFDGWTWSMAASIAPLAGEVARHIVSTNWL